MSHEALVIDIPEVSNAPWIEVESTGRPERVHRPQKELAVPRRMALERKRSTMMLFVLGGYAACAIAFTPRMLALFSEAQTWLGVVVISLFLIQMHVFWLYGTFLVGQAIFSWVAWPVRRKPAPCATDGPPVAILYTTMHDFQERAVLSCIQQEYPHCHTFILDDSLREDAKAEVDDFARRYAGQVTVVRRTDRTGYKAGNINHALTHHVHGFEFFAVADADSVFPPRFIAELLPHFGNDPAVGFVQGGFEPSLNPSSSFARDLGLQIKSMWKVFAPARNLFGSVIFLGHGGIIRTSVWSEVGGFPPLISEDLALSLRARRLGYRGRFVPEVISYEEFPESYAAFRKQQKRYVQGICQYIHREGLSYLTARNIPWFEKADTLLTAGGLLMPLFFLSFIILFSVIMPFMFGVHNLFAVQLGTTEILLPVFLLSERFFDLGLALDYFVITGVCTLAPTLGGFWLALRYPIRGVRTIWLASAPYMSLLVMSSVATLSYCLFRSAKFTATGDRSAKAKGLVGEQTSMGARASSWLGNLIREDNVTALLEIALGVTLAVMCIATLNVVLVAFALAILLAPLMVHLEWRNALLRPLLFLPFLALCSGLAIGATALFWGR